MRVPIPALVLVFAEWKGYGAGWRQHLEGFNLWKSPFLEEQRNLARADAILKERRANLTMVLQARFPGESSELEGLVTQAAKPDILTQCTKLALSSASTDEVRNLLRQAADDNGNAQHD